MQTTPSWEPSPWPSEQPASRSSRFDLVLCFHRGGRPRSRPGRRRSSSTLARSPSCRRSRRPTTRWSEPRAWSSARGGGRGGWRWPHRQRCIHCSHPVLMWPAETHQCTHHVPSCWLFYLISNVLIISGYRRHPLCLSTELLDLFFIIN